MDFISGHDFFLTTQTWEYVIGLLGLALFVPFWRLVHTPTKKSSDQATKH